MASNDDSTHPPQAEGALPYPPMGNEPPGGTLPYPTESDRPPAGVLPYPTTAPGYPPPSSATSLPYPPTDSTLPYPPAASNTAYPPGPPATNNSPNHQPSPSDNKIGFEGKTYTDAPPPYSPPIGGTPYPTPPGAPGQLPPPQPGMAAYPAQPMPYQAPGTVTVTRTVQSTGPQVIVAGTCPTCRVGVLSENFTLLGICCAFWFFPLGIICCLSMREKRCTNCGSVFG